MTNIRPGDKIKHRASSQIAIAVSPICTDDEGGMYILVSKGFEPCLTIPLSAIKKVEE